MRLIIDASFPFDTILSGLGAERIKSVDLVSVGVQMVCSLEFLIVYEFSKVGVKHYASLSIGSQKSR